MCFLVVLEGMRIGSKTVSPFDFKIQSKEESKAGNVVLSISSLIYSLLPGAIFDSKE